MIEPVTPISFKTLEEGLLILKKEAEKGPISIGQMLHLLSGKGRALLLIVLALPFCQPIQIPGFSTPFGLLIAFIGFRMIFGQSVLLPRRWQKKEIHDKHMHLILDKGLELVKKIKPWIHPRLPNLIQGPFMKALHAIAIMFLGFFLALPLPIPLSNIIAAWSILFIGLGLLEDDGVFVLIGYLISLITIGVLCCGFLFISQIIDRMQCFM